MESGTLTAAATTSLNSKKVATHSHIKGLGLNETGSAESIASGFVGQLKAREVIEKEIYRALIVSLGCWFNCRFGQIQKDGRKGSFTCWTTWNW